jgi:hypothetical protein
MQKPRIYILQVLGMFILLCGYLLSDRPDSESVMHFDLSATHIITGASLGGNKQAANFTALPESKGHRHHKQRIPKAFSFNVILPKPIAQYCYRPVTGMAHITAYSESYIYLYAREINPPPPKAC